MAAGETVVYESRESANAPQLILTYSLAGNTAPTLNPSLSLELDSIFQGNGPPSGTVGTLISDLVDLQGGGGLDNVTDPDPGAVAGIAVTDADSSVGTWYYTTNDGSSWQLLGSIGINNARLLAADSQTRLYFQADPGFSGLISTAISFRAWDQTSGINGALGDTTAPGGSSPFSAGLDTASLTVTAASPIARTESPIVIDGSIDASWSTATIYSIDQLIEGSVAGPADLSATFRVMWDDTYIYTLIEVNDSTIIRDSLFWSMDDAVEIYLDPDYSHGNFYDGINDYNFGICAADDSLHLGINSEDDTTGFLHDTVVGAGGYVIEIAVPWATTLGELPVAGSLVGFDVQIDDDDDGLLRDGKLSWHDPANGAWFDPSAMGTMRLIGNNLPVIGGIDTGTVTEDVDVDGSELIHAWETLTISDPDPGQSAFQAETVSGTYGDLTIDSAGNWVYSADNTQAAIQQLGNGENLSDTLTVTTADGTTHDVVITINGTEDASVIGGIATGTVSEDTTLTSSNTLTVTDIDTPDNPSFDDVLLSLGDNGFGAFEMTGSTWTYTLNNGLAAVQALGAGQSLTDTYTFLATDGSSQQVTITIDGTDDPSVIGGVTTGSVAEDATLSSSNTLTIGDPDSPDNPFFTDVAATIGDSGYGDFSISSNTWSYTLNNSLAAVQALGAGESLTDTYTFFASDGSSQQVTITIDGTDDPSVIGGISSGTVAEDTTLSVSNSLTISDSDSPDNPSFTDVTATPGDSGYGDFSISSNTWTYSLNNSLAAVQSLGAGQSLTDTYTFFASDGSSQQVTITIDGTDDPSVIGGVAVGTVAEDTTLSTSNSLTITDPDSPDNPFFTDVAATLGDIGYGNFSISSNTWTYTLNNSLAAVQSLGAGQSLTDTYTFFASDGSSQQVTITINGTDDPSVITGIDSGSVSEDGSPTASETLTITDPDSSDSPSFIAVAPTAGDNGYGSFTISSGTWTYTLSNALPVIQGLDDGEVLTDTYTFFASDGSSREVSITITGAEDAPVVQNSIPDQTASEEVPFNFTFALDSFADADSGDTLSYQATRSDDSPLPSWLGFNGATRTFSGTPAESDVGVLGVKVSATDGSVSASTIFTLTVMNVNDVPVAVGDADSATINTAITTTSVLVNDIMGDGTTSISGFDGTSANGGTVSYNGDGTFAYTPAADFLGADTFTYTISDSDGETSSATVTVTVNPGATGSPGPDPVDPDPVDPEPIDPGSGDPVEPVDETGGEETTATTAEATEEAEPADTALETDSTDETTTPAVVDSSEDSDKTTGSDAKDKSRADSAVAGQDPEISQSNNDDDIIPVDMTVAEKSDSARGFERQVEVQEIGEKESTSTTMLLLARYLDHVNFLDEMEYSSAISQLRDALDEFKGEAESEEQYYKTVIGSAIAVSTGLSVGYVVWLIRGGMLLSSMLFSMPAWQLADPLPLLAGSRTDDEEDEETLETMIRDSEKQQDQNNKHGRTPEDAAGS